MRASAKLGIGCIIIGRHLAKIAGAIHNRSPSICRFARRVLRDVAALPHWPTALRRRADSLSGDAASSVQQRGRRAASAALERRRAEIARSVIVMSWCKMYALYGLRLDAKCSRWKPL